MLEKTPKQTLLTWGGAYLLLPIGLLLPAAAFASIYGGRAEVLGILGSGLAQYAHIFMVGSIIVVPLILSFGKLARWRHGIAVCVAFLCYMFPSWLLSIGSVGFPLSRPMSDEEVTSLEDTFKIPTLRTFDSSEGIYLRLRRSDCNEAVKAYIASIGVNSAGSPLLRE